MKTETLFALDEIETSGRMRSVDPDKVGRLAESIKTLGLLNPIHVVASNDGASVRLVAGAHRLQAVISLGWGEIEAFVMDGMDDLHQQLAEIDENLMRAELTATQVAEHLQRRKEVWEAMQVQSAQDAPIESKREDGRGHRPEEFAAATESATGYSKSQTNRATKRAREVCQEARDLVRGTKLDTGAYLDRLTKLDADEQVAQVSADIDREQELQRNRELREEHEERKRIAAEQRRDAKAELCNYLFERIHGNEWGHFIDMVEAAGGSINADRLREWETPARRAA